LQQALIDNGGIQCGYCTPGFVIALTAHLLNSPALDEASLKTALDGNLCRCTGYAGILRAGATVHGLLPQLPADPAQRLPALIVAGIVPAYLQQITTQLAQLPPATACVSDGPLLAGGTDLLLRQPPWQAAALAQIDPSLDTLAWQDGQIVIGAGCSVAELALSPLLAAHLPALPQILRHVASSAIRQRATVGGNLVNASPIADLAVLLLALDAQLTLRSAQGERSLPLAQFYRGYKQLDLLPGEILATISFAPPAGQLHFEKVAHRDYLDIASVNSALLLQRDGPRIIHARFAAGGVAPVPLRLAAVEHALQGAELTPAHAMHVAELAAAQITPISDIRGSARYKRLLLRQQLLAALLALVPGLNPNAVMELL
jgi:xanthine dehydrogenase small subunit